MKSPLAAAFSATIYALLALAFAPFLLVAGGIVCLAGLRHGTGASLKLALSAGLISGGLVFLLTKGTGIVTVLLFALLPLVALAELLRRSESQGLSLSVAALAPLVFAFVVRMNVGDVNEFWLQRLTEFRVAVEAEGGEFLALTKLDMVAGMMHASTIALVMIFFAGALLLGRWWQAALYNPGGFGSEFRTLVLPKPVIGLAAVVSVLGLINLNSGGTLGLSGDALLVVMMLFAIQGLAIVHHHAKTRGLSSAFFVFIYIFLMILPHIVGTVLTFVGIMDNLADFRKLRGARHR